jgi:hypothetical protein
MVALAAFRETRLSSWGEGTCLLDLANTGDCSEDRLLQGSMNAIRQDLIGSLNGAGFGSGSGSDEGWKPFWQVFNGSLTLVCQAVPCESSFSESGIGVRAIGLIRVGCSAKLSGGLG